MSINRRDCLRECNNQSVPLEDFKVAFCDRCLQPECTRSTYGTSKFDIRTQTWVERLFTKVPRMGPEDPRYRDINSRDFSMSVAPKNGEWVDPRDATPEKTSIMVPSNFFVPARGPESDVPSGGILLANTPKNGDLYLPGAPTDQKSAKRDPWAAPEPLKPGEVVERGATVRFGVK